MTKKDQNGHLTPNQVVAHNLRRARLAQGWTQEETCARLRDVGVDWSKAVYSAAEHSVDGKRIRRFDADLLFAFCKIFQRSAAYFFAPPIPFDVRGDLLPRREQVAR